MPSPSPISRDQIDAAWGIYGPSAWNQQAQDGALYAFGRAKDEWGFDRVLMMAAAINQLYNAGHPRLIEATKLIVEAKQSGRLDPDLDPVDIVETIGLLPLGNAPRYYWPFASKFSHFFVSDRVPLFDRWALIAVEHYAGPLYSPDRGDLNRIFVEKLRPLTDPVSPPTSRQLDWFLWLSGMYRAWKAQDDPEQRKKLGISRGVQSMFKEPENQQTLELLLT